SSNEGSATTWFVPPTAGRPVAGGIVGAERPGAGTAADTAGGTDALCRGEAISHTMMTTHASAAAPAAEYLCRNTLCRAASEISATRARDGPGSIFRSLSLTDALASRGRPWYRLARLCCSFSAVARARR